MALVKCRECGHQVSTSAAACPGCGTKSFRPPSAARGRSILWLVAAFGISLYGWHLFSQYQTDKENDRLAANAVTIERGLRQAMSPDEYTAYKAKEAADIKAKDEQEAAAQAAKEQAETLRSERQSAVYMAESDARRSLKDPDSAKFSFQQVRANPAAAIGITICGYVNSKNSFGAYAGDQRYFVIDRAAYIDDDSESFSTRWSQLCR